MHGKGNFLKPDTSGQLRVQAGRRVQGLLSGRGTYSVGEEDELVRTFRWFCGVAYVVQGNWLVIIAVTKCLFFMSKWLIIVF